MQITLKKSSVHHSYDHATSFSVSELITLMNSENNIDVSDEKMSKKINSDIFLMSKLLLDSSCTSKNRSTVSRVFYISMSLLILFQLTVEISDRSACVVEMLIKVMCIKCVWMLHSENIVSQCNAVFHNKMMYCKCKKCVNKEMTCILVNTLIRCIN